MTEQRPNRSEASLTSASENEAHQHRSQPVAAPGARRSPQVPGEVPDRAMIAGVPNRRGPNRTDIGVPLTEFGTAQAIMGVFAAEPGEELNPARFEQATASYEELRKAYPADLPPTHPAPGYALAHGDAMASEMQAIEGASPTGSASAPGAAVGEAYNARPGGGTADVAAPAKTEAPAAEVGSAFTPSDMPPSMRSPSDATRPPQADAPGAPAGASSWASASPAPGNAQSLAGTLPAAKDGETNRDAEGSQAPPTNPARRNPLKRFRRK